MSAAYEAAAEVRDAIKQLPSRRDVIAAMVLAGITAHSGATDRRYPKQDESRAEAAVQQADALIAELDK